MIETKVHKSLIHVLIYHIYISFCYLFQSTKIIDFFLWFLKMQMFSYQAIAFVLLEIGKIINYYNSVYHCVPIFYIGVYFLGVLLQKQKRFKNE